MSGWQVGDLAVCVEDFGGICPATGAPTEVCKGKVYRVQRVGTGTDTFGRDHLCLGFVGFPMGKGFNAVIFRKVLPCDPAFAEQVRSLKPRVNA